MPKQQMLCCINVEVYFHDGLFFINDHDYMGILFCWLFLDKTLNNTLVSYYKNHLVIKNS